MALAAARNERRNHLVTVEAGTGAGEAQVSLADEIAAAEAAVAGPQRRVSELEAALEAAKERPDFAAAAEIDAQLPAAREALVVAEAKLRGFTEARAAVERERQAAERKAAEAQEQEQAHRMLEDAAAAEQMALDQVDEALTLMGGHLAAAKGAYQQAVAVEAAVLQAQRKAIEARRRLHEWPEHHPGPAPVGSNRCAVAADNNPLIAQLARWHP